MTRSRRNRCDARLWFVVTALCSISSVSCSEASRPSTAGSVPATGITLSSAHPSSCIRVGDAERVVEFGIDVAQNPDQQDLEIDLLRDAQIVNVFGVYPPTAPQRFRARLSPGTYSVDLRSDSEVLADGTSVELEISGATIC
jgi:hypothetical protein